MRVALWALLPALAASTATAGRQGLKLRRFNPFKNFFAGEDEAPTTPAPTWMGLPLYYEGKTPAHYFNMSHMERQDFFFRVERWHDRMKAAQEKKCRSPRPGEKTVYFVQHADAVPKTDDAPLWDLGLAQSKNYRYDPQMARAVSQDPNQRAQLIVTSPARKALQSAVIGFSDLLPDVPWEINTDARGFGWVEGTLVPELGATALYELSANATYEQSSTNLLSQYRDLPKDWHKSTKPHKDRWYDFVDYLLERPEQRMIIVTHSGMIKNANITKTHSGEVHVAALLPDRTWRKLSPPDCWPASA